MTKALESEIAYSTPWIRVRKDTLPTKTGTTEYSVIERSNSAIIIVMTADGQTLFLKQHRHPINQNSWEIPMGALDKDESFELAVIRELYEETGIQAQQVEKIGSYHPVPGLIEQQSDVFVTYVELHQLEKALTHPPTDDILERKIVTLTQAYEMILNGEVTDGFTLVAFLYLKLWLEKNSQQP